MNFYHGTTKPNLENILRTGLRPGAYLSTHYLVAAAFGRYVLEVSLPRTWPLTPGFIPEVGEGDWDEYVTKAPIPPKYVRFLGRYYG